MDNTQLTVSKSFSLTPTSLKEAMEFSEIISKSSFVPTNFQGKPGDILVAVQMGSELGLPPIQSLQNIAVINGKPSIYGDAALAIVQAHPAYEWIDEKIEGDIANKTAKAICKIKRKGNPEHIVEFSIKDAEAANLWTKSGPWKQYPARMLQMRARGFALRDKFADALKGLITREEAMDYSSNGHSQPKDVTPIEVETVIKDVPDPLALIPQKEAELQEAESYNTNRLKDLIEECDVSSQEIVSWLEKANVHSLLHLGYDKTKKLILMLEKRHKLAAARASGI